jgi:hypothetical protein
MQHQFFESQGTKDTYHLRAYMKFHPIFHIYYLILIKFSNEHLNMKLFCQNQHAEGQSLLIGINKITLTHVDNLLSISPSPPTTTTPKDHHYS